ncbi:HAD family hydrolase [Sphingobacterium sp. SRCM116780]|uniref:HAD family hydrolase n=1 Tax=Sphingobacterium sp. SRCM116780 TaxID=2907623 RepID=UPI001F3ACAA6|nr:HAD family hydrolase [Sphingobacterium sp. SRCM116780]UIR55800.1 HAD family hydrolase [Sphingobacterium sp. SRCM116780]
MKLIIFDLDGTLLDTLQDLGDSCNTILQRYGYPAHPIVSYKKFVGNGVRNLIERVLPIEARTNETIELLLTSFKEFYEKNANQQTQPYPGIIPLLQTLKSNKYLISIASNKYHEAVLPLIDRYFPEIEFDLILGHRDGHAPKPNPDIVLETLQILGIQASDCYYVGDSSVDMDTANHSGTCAIGVTWGFRDEVELREHGAVHIIHRPQKLLDIID